MSLLSLDHFLNVHALYIEFVQSASINMSRLVMPPSLMTHNFISSSHVLIINIFMLCYNALKLMIFKTKSHGCPDVL